MQMFFRKHQGREGSCVERGKLYYVELQFQMWLPLNPWSSEVVGWPFTVTLSWNKAAEPPFSLCISLWTPAASRKGCWFEWMEAALHTEGNSWGRLIIAVYLLRAFTVREVKNHPFVKCDLHRIWMCPYWFKKINSIGNSLVVQWFGLHTSTAWTMGSIPGQGTKVLNALWPKSK